MSIHYDTGARKRAVNLTLNEDLVVQARGLTNNLSAVVESLLADFLAQAKQRRVAELTAVKATIATWTAFAENHESFADDHSTL